MAQTLEEMLDKARWHPFGNRSSHEAILFSMTDQPVIEALGFWRVDELTAPAARP